jgi:ribonuclease VapC
MVLDTSVFLAIFQDEPERRTFNEVIESADSRALSVATFVETSMVLESRYGAEGIRDFDLFLSKASISVLPVDVDQAHLARQAFRQYGKGRHPASLNFGDCFSYALAKSLAQPLLYKGQDFSQTDIQAAVKAEQ